VKRFSKIVLSCALGSLADQSVGTEPKRALQLGGRQTIGWPRAFRLAFLLALAITISLCARDANAGRSRLITSASTSFSYNVKDYGATGNGTTDDTAAIQAALNAAGIGGRVSCPRGIYELSGPLLYDDDQTIEGESIGGEPLDMGGCIFETRRGTPTPAFRAKKQASATTKRPRFRDFGIQLNNANDVGLDLSRTDGAVVANVLVRGTGAMNGQIGMLIDSNPTSGVGISVQDSEIYNLDRGIVIRRAGNDTAIGPNNRIYQCATTGVSIQGVCIGGSCTARDNCETITDCASCGGTACSANASGINNNAHVFQNRLEGNGVHIADVGKGTIIRDNYLDKALGSLAVQILAAGFDTLIDGNFFQLSSVETGILLPGATTNTVRVTVRGNVFKGLGAALSETSAGVDIDVERNMFESVTSKVTIASGSRLRVLGVPAASAPPNTCTAARTGERYFDLDQFEVCVCNGSAWTQEDGGGTSGCS